MHMMQAVYNSVFKYKPQLFKVLAGILGCVIYSFEGETTSNGNFPPFSYMSYTLESSETDDYS